MLFTNHSCDPNIALQGQIVFVAMRDIAAARSSRTTGPPRMTATTR
jgi:hypothetical protein